MKLEFIKSNEEEAALALTTCIASNLQQGKKVLWLVTGGSNIPTGAKVMNKVRESVKDGELQNLAITLTDERYGPVGHPESNWQRLVNNNFSFETVEAVPVLVGLSFEETVMRYSQEVEKLFAWADVVIGQFGVGADGHIAGVLPNSIAVDSSDTTVGYESEAFTRVTLTLDTIEKISTAYVLIFGEAKKDIVQSFHADISLADMPAQIVKTIENAYIYSDQI